MDRRQEAAWDRGARAAVTRGPRKIALTVHDAPGARRALRSAEVLGIELDLVSAQGAAGYWGVGVLAALERELGRGILVDCGEEAGTVIAALSAGCRTVLFTGAESVAIRLASMAAQVGAQIVTEPPRPRLELWPEDDVQATLEALCRAR